MSTKQKIYCTKVSKSWDYLKWFSILFGEIIKRTRIYIYLSSKPMGISFSSIFTCKKQLICISESVSSLLILLLTSAVPFLIVNMLWLCLRCKKIWLCGQPSLLQSHFNHLLLTFFDSCQLKWGRSLTSQKRDNGRHGKGSPKRGSCRSNLG